MTDKSDNPVLRLKSAVDFSILVTHNKYLNAMILP